MKEMQTVIYVHLGRYNNNDSLSSLQNCVSMVSFAAMLTIPNLPIVKEMHLWVSWFMWMISYLLKMILTLVRNLRTNSTRGRGRKRRSSAADSTAMDINPSPPPRYLISQFS